MFWTKEAFSEHNAPKMNEDKPWSASENLPLPPLILFLGSVAWKAVEVFSNVEFLMSIDNESVESAYRLFADYGSWVLMVGAAIWGMAQWQSKKRMTVSWSLVASVAVITFLWGFLLAVRATGHVPKVIVSWGGGDPSNCLGVLDTRRLQPYRRKFDVALACGIDDPSVDRMKDTAITISPLHTIVPGTQKILVHTSPAMAEKIASQKAMTVWYKAVLLPKDIYMGKITTLFEVPKNGGKIIDRALWDE
jgi:hypothetical protein